jgi:hypothetical protein
VDATLSTLLKDTTHHFSTAAKSIFLAGQNETPEEIRFFKKEAQKRYYFSGLVGKSRTLRR